MVSKMVGIMATCKYCNRSFHGEIPPCHEIVCSKNPAVKEMKEIIGKLKKIQKSRKVEERAFLENIINSLEYETRETIEQKNKGFMEYIDKYLV